MKEKRHDKRLETQKTMGNLAVQLAVMIGLALIYLQVGCWALQWLQGGAEATMLREVWERVVPAEQLACCEVHLDGQPLASHWGFVDGDRFLSFHMAYDNEYRSYGLGSVMLEDMVQHGREIGLRWIDASRGNTAGTHILGQYGGPIRQQVQLVLPRRSLSGLWVRMRCKARQAKARRAEAEAAAAGKA